MKKCLSFVLSLFLVVSISSPSGISAPEIQVSKSKKRSWLSQFFGKKETSDSSKAGEVKTLKPVLVSASRLASFQRTPEDFSTNVSYKSLEEVQRAHPATFQDTVKDLEGVHFFDATGNGYDEVFSLRGFPDSSDSVFLIDGVRINEVDGFSVLLPLIRTDNLESVEIQRGSSSAIYGSGAFAGVVNLKTKSPSKKPFSFFGGADWSSFRGVHFYDGVSGTIQDKITPLKGAWNYYFSMGRDQKRGFRSNGEFRDTSIDFKTAYELPDEEGGIRFGFKNINDAISNPGALTLAEYRDDYSQSKQLLDGRKMDSKLLYLNANKRFLDHRLNASLQGSIRRRTSRFYSTFRTFTDFFDGFDPDTDLVTTRSRERNVTGQLTYEDEWDWIRSESLFGAEFTQGSSHDKRQDAFLGQVVERTAIETLRDGETSSFGIFGNERIKLWDKFTTEFGIRGSFHWTAIVDRLAHENDFNRHWRDLSVNVGNIYEPFKWAALFWNYSQAFKVPQFSDLNSFGGDPSANLRPETAETFEVGKRLKYKEIVKTKFSYFDTYTHDEITFDSSAITSTNQFGRNVNAGKTRRNGVETRIDVQVIKEFAIYGTYTFTRARILKSTDTNSPVAGRFIGQIPFHQWTFGIDARPLKRLGSYYENFRILLNAVFIGRQPIQSFESTSQNLLNLAGEQIDPYQVWDLKLSYERNRKEVFLKINNLFDQRYYSRAVAATSFGTQTTPAGNYLFLTPASPREFILGVKYEF